MKGTSIFTKPVFAFLIVFCAAFILFTYKFLQVPPGIETDEGSIAYNSALISKTLRDQNNRFLPFFVLAIDKIDWKQPVFIYSSAAYFKIFGTSLSTFKQVSLIYSLLSLVLTWLFLRILFTEREALMGTAILITAPMVIVASRLSTEAILPLFFSSAWILSICMFRKSEKVIYLVGAALMLGISIYCYKGMRLIVPPWVIMTGLYIYWKSLMRVKIQDAASVRGVLSKIKQSIVNKTLIVNLTVFTLTILPFFLVMPILESRYPGAVFDRRDIKIESYRHLAYYWLSNLNLGFLFGDGEIGRIFRVELYGTFLLSTLPLFLIGLKKSFDKVTFFTFISVAFLVSPILFVMAGTFGYGHRLIAAIPLYVIITTLGLHFYGRWLRESIGSGKIVRKIGAIAITTALGLFSVINFFDFASYYYFEFPKLNDTKISFSNDLDRPFYELSQKAKVANLTPYIQDDIYNRHGEGNKFFEVAYFDKPLKLWKLGQELPSHSVLLTQTEKMDGVRDSGINVAPLHILIFD